MGLSCPRVKCDDDVSLQTLLEHLHLVPTGAKDRWQRWHLIALCRIYVVWHITVNLAVWLEGERCRKL